MQSINKTKLWPSKLLLEVSRHKGFSGVKNLLELYRVFRTDTSFYILLYVSTNDMSEAMRFPVQILLPMRIVNSELAYYLSSSIFSRISYLHCRKQ